MSDPLSDPSPDPSDRFAAADQIAAALARLRPRRGGPPWTGRGDTEGAGPRHPWSERGPRGHRGPPAAGPEAAAMPPHFGGPARLRLLESLAAAAHPLSVGEIGEAIGVDQPRASRLVQQCVQLDLVRREADPDDARRTRVALTDAGRRLVRGFRGERREAIAQALETFTEDERTELARLLAKLADNLSG
ncbi:MarR family winged helix-turn-helix transcriptional regulator [Microbacterium sp. ET2]|uniref:MarR family winged helix-turn-helix transcriptional regulator n=1 Tax=Microbacterium albipurpureum TaxID=3050384 RepID=UPI00259D24BA|nr:MarR family winged helix-turn-helix transcriptional regulator [Microbacterium sp. ET2 (Ac-2212)]WJL94324.1 MarR family winged helix-turn-helix transcriptional regulator [Microbacterium sp. ET2 (Ac-2212)]